MELAPTMAEAIAATQQAREKAIEAREASVALREQEVDQQEKEIEQLRKEKAAMGQLRIELDWLKIENAKLKAESQPLVDEVGINLRPGDQQATQSKGQLYPSVASSSTLTWMDQDQIQTLPAA